MRGKPKKGQYGYRNYHRNLQLAKVIFGGAMILVQLGARKFTDNQAAKNILTVMAILSVLPTANVASSLLASWIYKTPGKEFYERVRLFEEKGLILYDLIITSKEQIMAMDAIMVHPLGVFALVSSPKTDGKKAEVFLNDIFKAHRLTPHVKVIKEERAFLKRLDSLRPAGELEDDGSLEYGADVLKHLSM
ncbi:MAG: O-linked GlcNAc transferase-like protein [Hungatella sp.]|nr:O-linked GlcNAc transferase-like protein [Hungatella sp.]